MEEKGNILPMNPSKGKVTEKKKLTYEELENACHQLSEQARQMYLKLQESNQFNLFKRLDYLFKVLENAPMFSEDFITRCTDEIEETITIPVSDSGDTDSEDKVDPSKEETLK